MLNFLKSFWTKLKTFINVFRISKFLAIVLLLSFFIIFNYGCLYILYLPDLAHMYVFKSKGLLNFFIDSRFNTEVITFVASILNLELNSTVLGLLTLMVWGNFLILILSLMSPLLAIILAAIILVPAIMLVDTISCNFVLGVNVLVENQFFYVVRWLSYDEKAKYYEEFLHAQPVMTPGLFRLIMWYLPIEEIYPLIEHVHHPREMDDILLNYMIEWEKTRTRWWDSWDFNLWDSKWHLLVGAACLYYLIFC